MLQERRAASELQAKLRTGQFVITAEITPPVSTDPAEFLRRAMPLKGLATAVNVTDGAGAKGPPPRGQPPRWRGPKGTLLKSRPPPFPGAVGHGADFPDDLP